MQILNIEIPLNKNFKSSIRTLYGIGIRKADKIASVFGIHENTKIEYLFNFDLVKVGSYIEKMKVDFELRQIVALNITSLRVNKTFRGYRHKLGLPTRGQRTHTNASTARKLLKSKAEVVERDREKNRGPKRKKQKK